jgi:hypothetical protein
MSSISASGVTSRRRIQDVTTVAITDLALDCN